MCTVAQNHQNVGRPLEAEKFFQRARDVGAGLTLTLSLSLSLSLSFSLSFSFPPSLAPSPPPPLKLKPYTLAQVPYHRVDHLSFIKSQLALTQLTSRPYVVHIWSRNTL